VLSTKLMPNGVVCICMGGDLAPLARAPLSARSEVSALPMFARSSSQTGPRAPGRTCRNW
jgi:hypothetical protein